MTYIYTYARHEDEAELCELELYHLFGSKRITSRYVISQDDVPISVDRSPFTKRRIQMMTEADSMTEMGAILSSLEFDLQDRTFKVLFTPGDDTFTYDEQRQIERIVGSVIKGKADMRQPDQLYGIIKVGNRWVFGPCEESSEVWLKHSHKPQNYSTALPTKAARAIVNIAAATNKECPSNELRYIDPCCGMGTVLIEALSMGYSIRGLDVNPLAVRGARMNLSHFGFPDVVKLGDMLQCEEVFDVAIVDMPYNLCSVLPTEEQTNMLHHIRQLSKRAVIVTTEGIEQQLVSAQFQIKFKAALRKSSFTRFITVVE